jgi:hypothetical protein
MNNIFISVILALCAMLSFLATILSGIPTVQVLISATTGRKNGWIWVLTHHSRIPKEVTSNFRGNRYSCTKILAVSRPISGF